MTLHRYRKFVFALAALAALVACIFSGKLDGDAFMWSFVGLVSAFMTGNGLEWFARRSMPAVAASKPSPETKTNEDAPDVE